MWCAWEDGSRGPHSHYAARIVVDKKILALGKLGVGPPEQHILVGLIGQSAGLPSVKGWTHYILRYLHVHRGMVALECFDQQVEE